MSPRTPPGQTREKIYRFVRQRLIDGLPPTVREIQEYFGFRAVQTVQEHLRRLVAEGRLVKLKGKARGYSLPVEDRPGRPVVRFVPLLGRIQAGELNTAIEDCEGYVPVVSGGTGLGGAMGQTTGSGFAAPLGTAGDSAHADGPARGARDASSPVQGTDPQDYTDEPAANASPATGAGPVTTYHNIGPVDPSPAGGDAFLDHLQANQPTGSGQLFALRVQGESMTGAGILPGDIVIVRSQPTANSGDIVVALIDDEATVKTLRVRGSQLELHPENPDYEPIIPGPNECVILGKVIETRRYVEPLTL